MSVLIYRILRNTKQQLLLSHVIIIISFVDVAFNQSTVDVTILRLFDGIHAKPFWNQS